MHDLTWDIFQFLVYVGMGSILLQALIEKMGIWIYYYNEPPGDDLYEHASVTADKRFYYE